LASELAVEPLEERAERVSSAGVSAEESITWRSRVVFSMPYSLPWSSAQETAPKV
jgi:hypothetical protein